MGYYIAKGTWYHGLAETSGKETQLFVANDDFDAREKALEVARSHDFTLRKILKITALEELKS